MMCLLRHWVLILSVIGSFMQPLCVAAANDPLPEYTVKAGYLYNFAMLTEWPPGTDGVSLELCIYGNQDFGPALEGMRGKMVNGRTINIRYLAARDDAKECHVLFIRDVERAAIPRLMKEIAGLPILTVTDDESLAQAGAVIFLRPERQRLVFEINVGAARSASLSISSRLLRLARGGVSE